MRGECNFSIHALHAFVRYILVLHKPQYKLLAYLVYFLCLELKHGVRMQLDTHLCEGNTEQLPKCLCECQDTRCWAWL